MEETLHGMHLVLDEKKRQFEILKEAVINSAIYDTFVNR